MIEGRFDVIVAGCGAVGGATLYQLARRGVKVLGIDQFSPPHDRGSSHGETRITRLALGEGGEYVQFARRSHEIWRELESATGRSLLRQVGALIYGSQSHRTSTHGASDFLRTTIEVAERHGIRHELLSADQLVKRFPQFRFRGDEIGYHEFEGGFVHPESCIAAQLEMAMKLGASLRTGEKVVAWDALSGGVKVRTERGHYEAQQVVLTTGAWLPTLAPVLEGKARVMRQVLFWFEPDGRDEDFVPGRMPVFIRVPDGSTEMFYGFPPVQDRESGLKVAAEQFERVVEPDAMDRQVTDDEIRAMFEVAAPHVRITARCIRASACLYTVTPDFGFVIDRHPASDRVVLASACSGHGFKHSAAVGEALAELVLGGARSFDLGSFSLKRLNGTAG